MKSLINGGIAVSLACLLSACATPTVVQTVKPGDAGLSCAQLQNEFSDAERFRQEADKEKTITGGNVVRALFFWPAILGTAANANEAIAAASLSEILCVRHNMTPRSMNAKQDKDKRCGAKVSAPDSAAKDFS